MAPKQLLAWTLLAASPCLLAEGPERYRQVSVTNTDRTTFAPGGTIRVNDSSGHVMVEGWDQNEVEVTVVKSMPYGYNKEQAGEEYLSMTFPEGWSEIPAVREGRVYAFDANSYVSRPGPRLVTGIEAMAKAMHPQIHVHDGVEGTFYRIADSVRAASA